MDYNLQLLELKMSSLIFSGLVQSDQEYIYVENASTKEIKTEIEHIIGIFENLKVL
jgi:hypothetical protein